MASRWLWEFGHQGLYIDSSLSDTTEKCSPYHQKIVRLNPKDATAIQGQEYKSSHDLLVD